MREIEEIPNRVHIGFHSWPTARFRENVVKEQARLRDLEAKMGRLPPPEIPDVIISLSTLEDCSFVEQSTGYVKKEELPSAVDKPLVYLEKAASIVEQTVGTIAWKNKVYDREGYEILHVGFRDLYNPSGFDEEALPDFMRYCPEFENEILQRLIAAQYARQELLRIGEVTEKKADHQVKRVVSVHEYSRNIGSNRLRLANYLMGAFRTNMVRIEELAISQGGREKELADALKEWAEQTRVAFDSRGDSLRKGVLKKATQWTIPEKPLLL